MTGTREGTVAPRDQATRDRTLVWIDAREAVIARWHADDVQFERLRSDVPPHRRTTGHMRYGQPGIGHGAVAPQDPGEAKRLEHLARFVELVAGQVPTDDDLVILGPGTVRDRLEHRIRETDRHASRTREVTCAPSPRLTDRQLVARLRDSAGATARRHTVGPYRWTGASIRRPSGAIAPRPRRATRKAPAEIDEADMIEEELG